MEKEVWRFVLQQQSDQRLSYLVQKLDVQVPGFRKNGKITSKVRPLLVTQLLKPKQLGRMSNNEVELHEDWEEVVDWDAISEEALVTIEKVPPSLVLFKLLSRGEKEKAVRVYQAWMDQHGIEELLRVEEERKSEFGDEKKVEAETKNEEAIPSPTPVVSSSNEEKRLEKIHKKLEQKIQTLQQELSKVQTEFTEYKKTQKERLDIEKKKVQEQKQETTDAQRACQKVEAALMEKEEAWKLEKKAWEGKLKTLQEENNALHAKLLNPPTPPPTAVEQEVAATVERDEKKKVVLLGNPRNTRIFKDCPCEIRIVEKSDLSSLSIEEGEAVWGLAYKVNDQLLVEAEKRVNQPVARIRTFLELKEKIEKEKGQYEKQTMER
ncbi:hypothetical protein ACQCT3_10665 [Sutcliffiella horikoshii]|uniref:hypothetical protein n=1 Tax=Sutcliffiella horikoshii TaxID=79883 RepID=UPI003CF007D9